jgi:hypothetical protein
MDDDIDSRHRRRERIGIGQVADRRFDVQPLQQRSIRRDPRQDPHGVTQLDGAASHKAANHSRGAGNQNSFCGHDQWLPVL